MSGPLHLKPYDRTPWSDQDRKVLRTYYAIRGNEWVAEKLGRTCAAVQNRASAMGLHRQGQARGLWTEEENRVVRAGHATRSAKEMATELGRTVNAVRTRAVLLGLTSGKRKAAPPVVTAKGRSETRIRRTPEEISAAVRGQPPAKAVRVERAPAKASSAAAPPVWHPQGEYKTVPPPKEGYSPGAVAAVQVTIALAQPDFDRLRARADRQYLSVGSLTRAMVLRALDEKEKP